MARPDDATLATMASGRLADRQVSELIGFARGLTADGVLNVREVDALHAWLVASADVNGNPVIALLLNRVMAAKADGHVDNDECVDLFQALSRLAGGEMAEGETLRSTALPLCDPAPDVAFDGRRFCVTGTFTLGSRSQVEAAIAHRGGSCALVTGKTDYLVIGDYAADTWKFASFGTKIMRAVELRAQGAPIRIVSENHWRQYL